MVMIDGQAAVFAVWIGVIMMHGEVGNAMSSNSVVNVEIEHGILQWELPSGLSEQVSAYHVLVYREGHRMESPPMWVTRRVYNLSNLHLAAGTYYIEVQIILRSGDTGPYSDPIMHIVRGNTSFTLMLVAIASTIILGFLFGSLMFILSMWRLRQYSRPVGKCSNSTQGGGSSSNLEMNSNSSSPQVTSIDINTAYGCDRNAAILLPCNRGQTLKENEPIYETISDFSRSSTMDAGVVGLPMTYLLESEIQAPNSNLVPRTRGVCESSNTTSRSEYLEVLASNSTCVTTVNDLADENTIDPAS